MDEATLFSHCIVCTDGSVCSEPSPMYNGVCVSHSHNYAGLVSYHRQSYDAYYFCVFKPIFVKCIQTLLNEMACSKSHKQLEISQTIYSLQSKHRHFLKLYQNFSATTKRKLVELIDQVQGMSVFTSNGKITYAQSMKTYYHDIFPYDNHEFNL